MERWPPSGCTGGGRQRGARGGVRAEAPHPYGPRRSANVVPSTQAPAPSQGDCQFPYQPRFNNSGINSRMSSLCMPSLSDPGLPRCSGGKGPPLSESASARSFTTTTITTKNNGRHRRAGRLLLRPSTCNTRRDSAHWSLPPAPPQPPCVRYDRRQQRPHPR